MKNTLALRTSLRSLAVLGLFLSCLGFAATAQKPRAQAATANTEANNGGNGGGVRGGEGQTLRVTVKLGVKLMPGVRVKITVADGSVVLSGVTGKTGVYNAMLGQGSFTVTASTLHATATSPVTLVDSTDPLLLTLTLAPKP